MKGRRIHRFSAKEQENEPQTKKHDPNDFPPLRRIIRIFPKRPAKNDVDERKAPRPSWQSEAVYPFDSLHFREGEQPLYAFDHLVHLVHDPKKAMEALRKCGIQAVEGGSHSDWGTFNTLCYFDLSYIEYLGVENPAVAEKARDNPLVHQALEDLAHGEGPARIALRTDNLEEASRLLEEQGWRMNGPFPGIRIRPDGSVLRWTLMFPEWPDGELPPPFLIQWEQTDEERRRDLQLRKAMMPHPAGDLRLKHIAFTVQNLGRAAEWEKGFGLRPGKEYVDMELNAVCRELKLMGGHLLFCAPIGDGPVQRILQKRGERPFLVSFSGAERDEDWSILGGIYRLIRDP